MRNRLRVEKEEWNHKGEKTDCKGCPEQGFPYCRGFMLKGCRVIQMYFGV
jgi:hypothetical protein